MGRDHPTGEKPGFRQQEGSRAHGGQYRTLAMACTQPARKWRGGIGRYWRLQRGRQDQHVARACAGCIGITVEHVNRLPITLYPEMPHQQARRSMFCVISDPDGDLEQVG
ncbi:hypothetical protein D3C72_1410090 [compost metagenome]